MIFAQIVFFCALFLHLCVTTYYLEMFSPTLYLFTFQQCMCVCVFFFFIAGIFLFTSLSIYPSMSAELRVRGGECGITLY
jgi:hypothetical protein